jgi:sugar/nucleoside kinase (ribokinase family)
VSRTIAPQRKPGLPYRLLTGVGGIGTGMFFALEGVHTLGRNESRAGRLLDVRDYCKLHIISHYVAVLLGADPSGDSFVVLPIGKVGNDDIGLRLLGEMKRAGMDTRFVEPMDQAPTLLSVCFQYPDGSGGNITTSASAASALTAEDVDRALDMVASTGRNFLALAAPEVSLEVRRHFLERATTFGAFRAAAFTTTEIPCALDSGAMRFVDLLAMNEDEAQVMVGMEFDVRDPLPFLQRCEKALSASGGDVRIVVTAGKTGAFAVHSGSWDYCPAPEVPVASTAGAGDALLGGILAGLARGLPFIRSGRPRSLIVDRPLSSAFELGVLLAAFTVTSHHTIHPDANVASLTAFADRLGIILDADLRRALRTE